MAKASSAIKAAYKKLLGRAPDPSGIASYNDLSQSEIENAIRQSAEYKSKTGGGGTNYKAIVTKAYKDILYRNPDVGGLQNYINYLQSGGSEANLREILSGSPEGQTAPYRKAYRDWYSMEPKRPSSYQYTPEEEAADWRTARETDRPYFQEKATESGEEYKTALQNARQGFSRRGLWGAAATTPTAQIDPTTGLSYTTDTPTGITGGPQSGLRQVGEQKLSEVSQRQNTAFGRAYEESTKSTSEMLQNQRRGVYQTTIWDPYQEQKQTWQNLLSKYLYGLK